MRSKLENLAALDERLSFIDDKSFQLDPPEDGWLYAVRDGLGVSQREAAALAGVTQQAFNQFESGELRASITLERLQKAAAALGCDVVYFLKPKRGTFTALAEARSEPRKPVGKSTPMYVSRDEDLPVNLL